MSSMRMIGVFLLCTLSFNSLPAQSEFNQGSQRKLVATVLGKPVYQSDLNKNLSSKDNLIRLVINPLVVAYCEKHGITRDEELRKHIKNDAMRAAARQFVLRAELNRHLYEKHGGRVLLDPFGPVAIDGMKKWITDHLESGDLQIADPEIAASIDAFTNSIKRINGRSYASPAQIKGAFDPSITLRFIKNMGSSEETSTGPVVSVSRPAVAGNQIGVVMGKPILLTPEQRDAPNLSEILFDLVVTPLEKAFLQEHPEIAPSERELTELSKHITSNGEESRKSLHRSLNKIDRKLKESVEGTDEYGELEYTRQVVLRKLDNVVDEGRRAKALLISRPAKLQQFLFDKYGGGRVIRRGPLLNAFDAQKKWIDELERKGKFVITDPALRAKFHEYWTNEKAHVGKLHDEPKARAWLNPPWIQPSAAAN